MFLFIKSMKQPFQKQEVEYTQIKNSVLLDKNLSLKAKGLFAYLYSKPEGWNFSHERMVYELQEGRDAILTGLSELEKFGYLVRKKQKSGRMSYFMRFDTSFPDPFEDEPNTDNPCQVNTECGKSRAISNIEYNNNKEKKDISFSTPVSGSPTQGSKNEVSSRKKKEPVDYEEVYRAKDGSFDNEKYFQELINNDKNKHVRIIGYYFITKGLSFPSYKAASIELRRNVRPASELLEYGYEKIANTLDWMFQQDWLKEWKLETVTKFINDPRISGR